MANEANPAPYMSYGIFEKSIETLAETTVPTGPLDRRVFSGFSGNDYSALISGLRFLGLIDGERKATQAYRDLVQSWADKPKFKEAVVNLISTRYRPIIGDVNLRQGTGAELEKAFRESGVASSQMQLKTIRFFLKALTDNGFALSPHITARKPRGAVSATRKNGNSRTRIQSKPPQSNSADSMATEEVPSGFERLPIPGMPNSFIQYPVNLSEGQCQIMEAMVGVLRKSVEARTGGKGKTT